MPTGRVPRQGRGLALVVDRERALAALWRNHLTGRSPASRLALFDHYRGFADRVARGHARWLAGLGLDHDDYRQLASEALLQALDRFDPLLPTRFESFARLRIRGHIRNRLDQASEASAQYARRQRTERDRLRSIRERDGGEPSALDRLAAVAAQLALGFLLEEPPPDPDTLPSPGPSAYETLAWGQLCNELDRQLAALPAKEALVLDRHYRQGEPFTQIALLLGLSKGRISQLHAQGLARLRRQMGKIR